MFIPCLNWIALYHNLHVSLDRQAFGSQCFSTLLFTLLFCHMSCFLIWQHGDVLCVVVLCFYAPLAKPAEGAYIVFALSFRVCVGRYPHSNRGPTTKGTIGPRLLSQTWQRKSLWSPVAITKSWTMEGPRLQVFTHLCVCVCAHHPCPSDISRRT